MRVLLERQPGLKVTGEAVDAEGLLSQIRTSCPDVVLLDWELPGLEVSELISALRAVCPGVLVVALSGRPEARQLAQELGVDAFVSKVDPPERLLAAIDGCGVKGPSWQAKGGGRWSEQGFVQ
jgi:DNA-binding NarL/FixJ family response regulator